MGSATTHEHQQQQCSAIFDGVATAIELVGNEHEVQMLHDQPCPSHANEMNMKQTKN